MVSTSVNTRISHKRIVQRTGIEDTDQIIMGTLLPHSSNSSSGVPPLIDDETNFHLKLQSGSILLRTRSHTIQHTSHSNNVDEKNAARRDGYVFALYGNHYVPAKVIDTWRKASQGGSSSVVFCRLGLENGTLFEAPLNVLYRCEVREGDHLCIPGVRGGRFGRNGTVVDIQNWERSGQVTVHPELMPVKKVDIFSSKDIAATPDVLCKEWDDRKVGKIEDVKRMLSLPPTKQVKDSTRGTKNLHLLPHGNAVQSADVAPLSKGLRSTPPQTSKFLFGKRIRILAASTPSTLLKPLSGCAFIISLSLTDKAGNHIAQTLRNQNKAKLERNIRDLGGRVIEDNLAELVRFGGSFNGGGSRWIWDKEHLDFEGRAPVKRRKGCTLLDASFASPEPVFLIADRANRSMKYMTALAIGIPCIHQGWIDSKVR
jgi:BRCA1 C Terminus (BRCT) domain